MDIHYRSVKQRPLFAVTKVGWCLFFFPKSISSIEKLVFSSWNLCTLQVSALSIQAGWKSLLSTAHIWSLRLWKPTRAHPVVDLRRGQRSKYSGCSVDGWRCWPAVLCHISHHCKRAFGRSGNQFLPSQPLLSSLPAAFFSHMGTGQGPPPMPTPPTSFSSSHVSS